MFTPFPSFLLASPDNTSHYLSLTILPVLDPANAEKRAKLNLLQPLGLLRESSKTKGAHAWTGQLSASSRWAGQLSVRVVVELCKSSRSDPPSRSSFALTNAGAEESA